MRLNKILLLILLITTIFSCTDKKNISEYGEGIHKPDDLISKGKMVNILYDLHLSEAFYDYYKDGKNINTNFSSKNFYKTVLDRYEISDSTLSASIIYYSSFPKNYEKIYTEVCERVGMNLESVKAKNKLLEDKTGKSQGMIFLRFPYIRYPEK